MESSSEQMWILLSEFVVNFAQIHPDNYLTEKRERKNKNKHKTLAKRWKRKSWSLTRDTKTECGFQCCWNQNSQQSFHERALEVGYNHLIANKRDMNDSFIEQSPPEIENQTK